MSGRVSNLRDFTSIDCCYLCDLNGAILIDCTPYCLKIGIASSPNGMFLSACFQVLDWIENHGEAFLSKHTGVGKSLHRARALQKRHEDFEEVAQVSF